MFEQRPKTPNTPLPRYGEFAGGEDCTKVFSRGVAVAVRLVEFVEGQRVPPKQTNEIAFDLRDINLFTAKRQRS